MNHLTEALGLKKVLRNLVHGTLLIPLFLFASFTFGFAAAWLFFWDLMKEAYTRSAGEALRKISKM